MNLHDIQGAPRTAWIWAAPIGRNGRPLGRGQYNHLYETRRNEIQQHRGLGDIYARQREYWQPWGYAPTVDRPLYPACGPIRTAGAYAYMGERRWRAANCPDCADLPIAARATTLAQLTRDDPWTQVPWNERQTTPDPVTGR